MTQVVSIASSRVGSLDWELPAKISADIEMLSPALQSMLMEHVKMIVEAHTLTIIGSLCLGHLTPDALQLISDRDQATTEELLKMASRL